MEIETQVKFDEQSKAVTATAGIKLTQSVENIEELDKMSEEILQRSKKLFEEAFKFSQEMTMRK
jgi:hypothetical protein